MLYAILATLMVVFLTTATVLASPASSVIDAKKTPSHTQPTKAPKMNTNQNQNAAANKGKTTKLKTVNYRGYVVSASETSLTILTKDLSMLNFVITANTSVHIPTMSRAAVMTDLLVNQMVNVHAKLDLTTQILTATSINMVPGQSDETNGSGMGTVTDYQPGISITIADAAGLLTTFQITATTKIVLEDPTLVLGVGSTVVVMTPRVAGTDTETEVTADPSVTVDPLATDVPSQPLVASAIYVKIPVVTTVIPVVTTEAPVVVETPAP